MLEDRFIESCGTQNAFSLETEAVSEGLRLDNWYILKNIVYRILSRDILWE
jgi:hypothetical protein